MNPQENAVYRIEMDNISKQFPGVKALDNVSLHVKPGEIHGLVGENGAGKSTLMKILSGVYQKDSGSVKVNGKEVAFHDPLDAQRGGVALCYQEPQTVGKISIAENIFLGSLPTKKNKLVDYDELYRRSSELAERVGLRKPVTAPASELSMGECQLVQIARALRVEAVSVLILDEPTSSLTERETDHLFDICRSLKESGISIIYISHRMDELFRICDTVTVLKDGTLVNSLPIEGLDKKSLVNMMVGRELGMNFPDKSQRTAGEVFLEADDMDDVSGRFHDISFNVRRGEVLGFGGLIGAGRTEVMDAIFGMGGIKQGRILIEGNPVSIKHPQDAIANHIAYVTEDRHGGMVLAHSIFSNMTLASLKQFVKGGLIDDEAARQACQKQMAATSIKAPSMNTLVNDLSGGNQQKVIFAKWLMKTADLYILDEPTRGIDVGAKEEIYKLIHELALSGKAVIVISSELPELIGISDRILVMCEGRIAGQVSGEEATETNIIQYATGVKTNA